MYICIYIDAYKGVYEIKKLIRTFTLYANQF